MWRGRLKKRWQLLLGVLVSLLFLWLAVQGLHLQEVLGYLRSANYWWLLPGVAVYFLAVWARTWRWHYLLRPVKVLAIRRLFPIVCIGYFGNNVFPARLGELLRAYVLRRDADVPISTSLAPIIIERVFDGLVMLLFVFLALPVRRAGAHPRHLPRGGHRRQRPLLRRAGDLPGGRDEAPARGCALSLLRRPLPAGPPAPPGRRVL